MNTLNTLGKRAVSILAVATIFACQAAQACPGCKNAVGGNGESGSLSVNPVGMAYAVSIGSLLFMIAAILCTLGYFAYKNCQAIAQAQQAAWEAEENATGGTLSAGRV